MADVVDIAQEFQERALSAQMAAQREAAQRGPALQPVGYCHNPACGEDLEGERLFCGAECAIEYDRFGRK